VNGFRTRHDRFWNNHGIMYSLVVKTSSGKTKTKAKTNVFETKTKTGKEFSIGTVPVPIFYCFQSTVFG